MVSSVHGRMYYPCQAAYAVSKHGLETIADSLRLEMIKFGVRVSVIEPGCYAHATSIHSGMQVCLFTIQHLTAMQKTMAGKHAKITST